MITASLNNGYNILNSQPQQLQSDTTTLLMDNTIYNNNNVLVGGDTTAVPDLLAEKSHNSGGGSSNNTLTSGLSPAGEAAVFLPTYATLPTTKLEEEPNPFEQSFEGASVKIQQQQQQQQRLPSVKSIDNPKPTRLDALENQWDSLRSSILSPSMLPGPTASPTNVIRRPVKYELDTTSTTFYNHTYKNPPPTVNRNNVKHTRKISNSSSSAEEGGLSSYNKKQKITKKNAGKDPEDEEKRKNFLERNRIAALKCRQRKKQWLQNLQTKVEYLAADNEQFHLQANALREELINLKTLLMVHKDCPINQQDLKIVLSRPIPGVPSLPHLLSTKNTNIEDN